MKKNLSLSLLLVSCLVLISSCTNYGDKVTNGYLEIYYKDGITRAQAQKTADFLFPYWKNANGKTETKSVQLTREGDTINFRMVTDQKKMAAVEDETFYSMGNIFSDSLFNGAPVNLVLANDHFKTLRTLHFRTPPPGVPVQSDSTH